MFYSIWSDDDTKEQLYIVLIYRCRSGDLPSILCIVVPIPLLMCAYFLSSLLLISHVFKHDNANLKLALYNCLYVSNKLSNPVGKSNENAI